MSKSWFRLIIVFLGGLGIAMSLYKVPGVMDILMEDLSMSVAAAGALVSILLVAGFIATLFAGPLMLKFGVKKCAITGMLIACVSGVIALPATDATLMNVSRFIEGFGYGLVASAGPSLVNMLFPPEKRGLPSGIWATWVTVGMLLVFNLAVFVAPTMGWRALWIIVAVINLVTAIMLGVLKIDETAVDESADEAGKKVSIKDVLKLPEVWCVAIVFLAATWTITPYSTYVPDFLMSKGYDYAGANSTASLLTVGCVIGALGIGVLADKMKNSWILLPIDAALLAVGSFLMFQIGSPFFIVVLGLVMGSLPALCFGHIGQLAPVPALIPMCATMLAIFDSLGGIISPLLDGALIESFGYSMPLFCAMASIPVLAFIAGVYVCRKRG